VKYINYILICIIFSFLGCSVFIKKITGIKNPRTVDDEQILRYAEKFNIPENCCFKIDTSLFFQKFYSLKDSDKKLLNDLFQPLQIKVFNPENEMELYLINCNVSGFPNIQWNRLGTFNTFPPDITSFKQVDTTFTFKNDLLLYQNMNNETADYTKYENSELNIIVFWAIFMGRQSKLLINEMKTYKERFSNKKINLIFVNVDNLFDRFTSN